MTEEEFRNAEIREEEEQRKYDEELEAQVKQNEAREAALVKQTKDQIDVYEGLDRQLTRKELAHYLDLKDFMDNFLAKL